MSKARNISNLFSGSTDAATDAEVTAAIATHAANTTARHYASGNTSSRPTSPNNGDLYTNTQTGFVEVYSGSTYGWEAVGAISSTVTGVSATDSPSGRAYNNGSASVAFTPGSVVGRSYTVTSSPGSYTATGSSSPLTVTGLQSSTQYTYTVTATNNYGTSSASSASSGVTATTVPQAPTIGTATGASQSATLTFTAGSTGGATISNYKYSTDGTTYTAFSPAQTTSPLTISGLTNGQSYSFYLKAVNTNGDSLASSASNSVMPDNPAFYEAIQTVTVASGGASSVTFSSIPQTYKHLEISYVGRSTANGMVYGRMAANGDTTSSNYTAHDFFAYASGAAASHYGNQSGLAIQKFTGSDAPTGSFGMGVATIADYSSTTKNKVSSTWGGVMVNNTSQPEADLVTGVWFSTSAITSLTIQLSTGNFVAGSQFALYGIKG